MRCLFTFNLTYRNLLQQLKIKALPIDNRLSAYLKNYPQSWDYLHFINKFLFIFLFLFIRFNKCFIALRFFHLLLYILAYALSELSGGETHASKKCFRNILLYIYFHIR